MIRSQDMLQGTAQYLITLLPCMPDKLTAGMLLVCCSSSSSSSIEGAVQQGLGIKEAASARSTHPPAPAAAATAAAIEKEQHVNSRYGAAAAAAAHWKRVNSRRWSLALWKQQKLEATNQNDHRNTSTAAAVQEQGRQGSIAAAEQHVVFIC